MWLAVAATAFIVGAGAFLQERLVESRVSAEILEAAGATALGVGAEIEESGALPDSQGLDDLLLRFARAEPSLQDLTIVERRGAEAQILVTTDDALPKEALRSGRLALHDGALHTSGGGAMHYVAAPLGAARHVRRAIIVSVSTESITRLRKQTRELAIGFGAATVMALLLLLGGLARRYEARLVEANQRLFGARRELAAMEELAVAGRMAASVAHQIGTPLNLISGHVQLLIADGADAAAPATSRLRIIQEQIGRVTTIVQGLLDGARLPEPSRAPLDPRGLVHDIFELARPTLESRKVRAEVLAPEHLPMIAGERAGLEQAFLNLISNAIDAMPDGGTLKMHVSDGDGNLRFEIADSGIGIEPRDVSRVFDPLFTTKPRGKGTGLGLAIVQDVVRSHGGKVEARSAPGEGTTFIVTLPHA
jgi:signal transduction histidine kinase